MFSNVVSSTLQLYFLPKSFMHCGLRYATQLKIRSVAFFSGARPLAIGLLSSKIGQVTGLPCLGSGIPWLVRTPELAEPDPHAASSEPAPPAAPSIRPAAPLCFRKPRRDSPGRGGVPSACQPSLGCMPHQPFV